MLHLLFHFLCFLLQDFKKDFRVKVFHQVESIFIKILDERIDKLSRIYISIPQLSAPLITVEEFATLLQCLTEYDDSIPLEWAWTLNSLNNDVEEVVDETVF